MFPNSILAHQALYLNALRQQQLFGGPHSLLTHASNLEAPHLKTDALRRNLPALRTPTELLRSNHDDVRAKQAPASPTSQRNPLLGNNNMKGEAMESEVANDSGDEESARVTSPGEEKTTLKFGIASILAATERDAARSKRGERDSCISRDVTRSLRSFPVLLSLASASALFASQSNKFNDDNAAIARHPIAVP